MKHNHLKPNRFSKILFLFLVFLSIAASPVFGLTIPAEVADSVDHKEVNLTKHKGEDRNPNWSPDGKTIVFESNRDGNWNIFLIKPDGSGLLRVAHSPVDERKPSWHPDGKRILFEREREGRKELVLIKPDGSGMQGIELHFPGDLRPTWGHFSPDGGQLLFSASTAEKPGHLELYMADKTGKQVRALTDGPYRSAWGVWSAKGDKIAFFSRRDTGGKVDDLYVMNRDGSGTRRITHHPTHNFCPSWSPDGQKLVNAVSMPDSRPELFLVNVDGSGVRRLTYNKNGDTEPAFSPDGKSIAFAGWRNGNYEICLLMME
ncbi:MAG: hypothetical protein GY940_45915 [bacterium]|nr:hypothetical protein [bacterium]